MVVAAVVVVVKWTGLKYPFRHLNSVPDFCRCSGANTEIIPKDSRVREEGSERRREVERERCLSYHRARAKGAEVGGGSGACGPWFICIRLVHLSRHCALLIYPRAPSQL